MDVDQKLRRLLNGDQRDQADALRIIERKLRHPVCSQIRLGFPGLSIQDISACWNSTLLGVWQASEDGRIDLRSEFKIDSLISTLCRRKAIDFLRRTVQFKDLVGHLGQALSETATGAYWKSINVEKRQGVLEEIRLLVSEMPSRQKVVLQLYIDLYPISSADLLVEVRRKTGEKVSLKAVERALDEGRKKVRQALDFFGKRGNERG